MAKNRGKRFEDMIREAFLKVSDVSVDRLHDQTTHLKGSSNICDFIVYKKPYEYYIECKSVHGGTLPLKNITSTQWDGLLEKSKISGVVAGVICWWVDYDSTAFLPIDMLRDLELMGYKSVSIKGDWQDFYDTWTWCWIEGRKKRVFFDYNMEEFFANIERSKS